jgi:hypothetical protein
VENFAAKQEQQTLANSWAHLYLLLGDSKVSSMHCQSPVQYSESRTVYQGPRNGVFKLLQRRARTAASLVITKMALHANNQLHWVPVEASAWGMYIHRTWDGQRGLNGARNRDIPVSS